MIKRLTTTSSVRDDHKHSKYVNKRIDRFFAAALTGHVSKYGIKQDPAGIEQIAEDCLYIAEGALEVLIRNHYSSEPLRYKLYADTQHGVLLADFDDFNQFEKGVLCDEDFLQALATCKEGEVLRGAVNQEVFDKIREEYGVRE